MVCHKVLLILTIRLLAVSFFSFKQTVINYPIRCGG